MLQEPYPLQSYQPDEPLPSGQVVPQGMTDEQAAIVTPCQNNRKEKRSILAEADAIAGEDRSRDYGHPFENHRRIADIWNVQLEKKLAAKIEPRDVALMMIGLKLARIVNSPNHRDSMVDIAGYLKCLDMIDERSAE